MTRPPGHGARGDVRRRKLAEGHGAGARLPGIAVAGKTGTAEFFRDWDKDGQPDRDEKGNLPTHAWFTAFAPYVDPEIVVTVFIANGGEGSRWPRRWPLRCSRPISTWTCRLMNDLWRRFDWVLLGLVLVLACSVS